MSGFRAPRPELTVKQRLASVACEAAVVGPGVRRGEGQIVAEARELLAERAENRAIARAREALEGRG